MVLANRSVILFKIKEFEFSIQDLRSAIETEKYPKENVHKLYHRLAKAFEQLLEFESAINCYEKVVKFLRISNITKTQKSQIKNETEKCIAFCKKEVISKNFTSLNLNNKQDVKDEFPTYKTPHSIIENASGK